MKNMLTIALCHMRHSMTGGTERYLNYLATHLCEQGHNVTIICRSHESKPHPNVKFVVLRPLAFGAAHRYFTFAKAFENHLKVHSYDVVFGLGRTWSQDIIRLGGGCHQTYLNKAHFVMRSKLKDDMSLKFLSHKVALSLEKKALTSRKLKKIICNSEMVINDVIRRYGVERGKIELIYNGVDLQKFSPKYRQHKGAELRQSLGYNKDHIVYLYLGTGYKRKGLDLVLNAFAQVLQKNISNARLMVVGYDSTINIYKQLATKLGIVEYVTFLGGRRDPEICYSAADIYLLPTRYDPFANSTLEALASGLPVITSTDNGGHELLEVDVNGSVIDVSNVDGADIALQNAMIYWADNSRLNSGAIAARNLAERHSAESKMEATLCLLAKLGNKQ